MVDTLIFLVVFAFSLVELIILALVGVFTPAILFLKAWLGVGGSNILGFVGKDRSLKFIQAKLENGMLIHTKGTHMLDSDSVVFESKSGKRVMIANEEVGITLSPRIAGIMAGMRDMGFDNIDEAQFFDQFYHECQDPKCGWKGLVVEKPQRIQEDREGIYEDVTKNEEESAGREDDNTGESEYEEYPDTTEEESPEQRPNPVHLDKDPGEGTLSDMRRTFGANEPSDRSQPLKIDTVFEAGTVLPSQLQPRNDRSDDTAESG